MAIRTVTQEGVFTRETKEIINENFSELAGGGGTPGGSDTQVQFNDTGSFGGDAELTWNPDATDGAFHVGVSDADLPPRMQGFWGDAQQSIFNTRADSTGLAIVCAPASGAGQGAIGAVAYGPTAVGLNVDAVGTTNDEIIGVLAGTAVDGAAVTAGIASGIKIVNASASNSAVIDTLYGLRIENQTRGNTNYAIKTGTGLVSLGDTVQAAGYLSSDGSEGVTAGPFTTITSITVKNGLIVDLQGS